MLHTLLNPFRQQTPVNKRRSGLATLTLLCAAQFMIVVDITIVNIALPSIQASLDFTTEADLQNVISLYALTFGGFLILAGRLADLWGRRRLFIAGLLVFACASLLCGFAPTALVLLIGRALQGCGSAMVSPAALSLLTTLFSEGEERNRALGVWGAMGAAGGATGMILGGILTAALGWEWIFFINLPIGLGAAIAAPGLLPADSSSETGKKLDLAGALTITLALGLLIFALNSSEQASFPIGLFLGLLAVAGILLVAFVVIERRTSQPLVAFRLFRLPGVTGANLAALLLNAIIASELFFTTLYLQQVLGLSALATGIAFLPNSALVLVGSALASRLVNRFGAGLTLAAGALILGVSAFLLSGVTAGGSYLINVMPGFTLTGLGLGLTFVALTISATSGVEERDQGLASGVVNTAIQLGSGVGIAAVVAVALALSQTSSGSMSARLVASYATGYLIDMVLALLIAVLALLLVHRHSRR